MNLESEHILQSEQNSLMETMDETVGDENSIILSLQESRKKPTENNNRTNHSPLYYWFRNLANYMVPNINNTEKWFMSFTVLPVRRLFDQSLYMFRSFPPNQTKPNQEAFCSAPEEQFRLNKLFLLIYRASWLDFYIVNAAKNHIEFIEIFLRNTGERRSMKMMARNREESN